MQTDDTKSLIEAPVRLCCMQRHYGSVCPDGRVMCCLCFGRFSVSELSVALNGGKQDVCIACDENEKRAAENGW